MAKRIKYQINDIIAIPVVDEKIFLGRILNKGEKVALIQVFHAEAIPSLNHYSSEMIDGTETLTIMWSYDSPIRNGTWRVLDNKPVDSYPEIYFWTEGLYGEYYSVKDNGRYEGGESTRINKEDIHAYYPYGISDQFNMVITIMDLLGMKRDSFTEVNDEAGYILSSNDDLIDWLDDLIHFNNFDYIKDTLNEIKDLTDLDKEDAARVIGGAEILCALQGVTGVEFKSMLDHDERSLLFVQKHLGEGKDWMPLALLLVQRVKSDSELNDLYEDTEEYEVWLDTITNLEERLKQGGERA